MSVFSERREKGRLGWRGAEKVDLTVEQASAVRCAAHALEIRAGAGTGKTHTLAHRVARLAPSPVEQSRALVVTFTRDATANLQRRLSLLMGRDHDVRVLSFHQWAARELPPEERRFVEDTTARRSIAEAIQRARPGPGFARALGVSPSGADDVASRILGVISYAKNAQTTLGAALDGPYAQLAPWRDVMESAQESYERKKGDRLDYDDLLIAFRDRLRDQSAFRRQVAGRIDHLFVDEYQDVNAIQADTVRLLTTGRGAPRVTVVGDPRQSIYGFRGGSPKHLEGFLAPYGTRGARRALTVCFRSERAIVDAGNRALPSAFPLRACPRAPAGRAPHVIECADMRIEAREVADRIEALLANGADARDIVVLARSRYLAGAYQEEVIERRADETWAADHGPALHAAIDAHVAQCRRNPIALGALAEELRGDAARATRVLARRARAAGPLPLRPTAARMLSLPRGEDLFHVKVLTIHGAKGLEWDHVLLLGAREGGLPSDHALTAPESAREELIEEERRLLYVAVTRARKTFTATWARAGERRVRDACRWLGVIACDGASSTAKDAVVMAKSDRGARTA